MPLGLQLKNAESRKGDSAWTLRKKWLDPESSELGMNSHRPSGVSHRGPCVTEISIFMGNF